ncbi:MAG: hypothetical protein L6R45_02850 [Anaerolineae bacterium]|nr:hypothetical protein [Anaerolineae bacterium]
MSRPAPLRMIKSFRRCLFSRIKVGPAPIWGRPELLLLSSIGLSLWLATGHIDANALFQSPVSPVIESPVAQPPAEQAPAEQLPVEQPPVEQAPAQQPPADQAGAPIAPTAPAPEPIRRDREEAPLDEVEGSGPAQFILDQAELIDTVVVSGAYVWLCCGVSLFLLVPLVLLFVYIRGRSRIIKEEGY